MKKKLSLSTVLLALLIPLFSQQTAPCGFNEVIEYELNNDPEALGKQIQFEQEYFQYVQQNVLRNNNDTTYTLPVVVHVVHLPGTPIGTDENLPDQAIRGGLDRLNAVFAGQPCGQDPPGNNMGLRFELARQDIRGNPTSGIVRHNSSFSEFGVGGYSFMILDVTDFGASFPTTDYINIYLVKSICYFITNGECQGPLGLATSSLSHGNIFDCVIVETDLWAGVDDPCSGAKLAAHEMGHFFNLLHTFDNGCPNDNCLVQGDRVCDTPPDDYQSRASSPCTTGQPVNSCSTDTDDTYCNDLIEDLPDPEENIMDYSPFACQYRFTQGQKDRMHATLLNPRASFLESKGLEDPCLPVITTDVFGLTRVVEDSLVSFEANAVNADSLVWLVDGEIVGYGPLLEYAFPEFGDHTVTLQAVNDAGCQVEENYPIKVYRTDCDLAVTVYPPPLICNSLFGQSDPFVRMEAYPSGGYWQDEEGVIVGGLGGGPSEVYLFNAEAGTHKLYYVYTEGWCQERTEIEYTITEEYLEVGFAGEVDCRDTNNPGVEMGIIADAQGYWINNQGETGSFSNFINDSVRTVAGTHQFFMEVEDGTCQVNFKAPARYENQIQIQPCDDCQGAVNLCVTGASDEAELQWYGGYPILPGNWEAWAIEENGCESWTRTIVQSVDNLRPNCNAGTSADIYCGKESILLGSVSPGGEIEYWWTTEDGSFVGPATNTLTPVINRPGTYVLHVRNRLSGCTDTDTTRVKPFVKRTSIEAAICEGEIYEGYTQTGLYIDTLSYACDCDSIRMLDLTVTSLQTEVVITNDDGTGSGSLQVTQTTGGVGPYLYTWSDGSTGDELAGLFQGQYILTTTDGSGCEHMDTFTVELSTGIAPFGQKSQLSVHPNPVSQGSTVRVAIQANPCKKFIIQVMDIYGRVLESHDHVQQDAKENLFLQMNTSGLYWVVISDQIQHNKAIKLVVLP